MDRSRRFFGVPSVSMHMYVYTFIYIYIYIHILCCIHVYVRTSASSAVGSSAAEARVEPHSGQKWRSGSRLVCFVWFGLWHGRTLKRFEAGCPWKVAVAGQLILAAQAQSECPGPTTQNDACRCYAVIKSFFFMDAEMFLKSGLIAELNHALSKCCLVTRCRSFRSPFFHCSRQKLVFILCQGRSSIAARDYANPRFFLEHIRARRYFHLVDHGRRKSANMIS